MRNEKWQCKWEYKWECKFSISPKIRQIKLWINRKIFFYWFVKLIYKKWLKWFDRQEILLKGKEKYSEEKAAEHYKENKEAIKEKSREHYKNFSQEEKDKINEYQRKRYQELVQYKKEALKNK